MSMAYPNRPGYPNMYAKSYDVGDVLFNQDSLESTEGVKQVVAIEPNYVPLIQFGLYEATPFFSFSFKKTIVKLVQKKGQGGQPQDDESVEFDQEDVVVVSGPLNNTPEANLRESGIGSKYKWDRNESYLNDSREVAFVRWEIIASLLSAKAPPVGISGVPEYFKTKAFRTITHYLIVANEQKGPQYFAARTQTQENAIQSEISLASKIVPIKKGVFIKLNFPLSMLLSFIARPILKFGMTIAKTYLSNYIPLIKEAESVGDLLISTLGTETQPIPKLGTNLKVLGPVSKELGLSSQKVIQLVAGKGTGYRRYHIRAQYIIGMFRWPNGYGQPWS